MACHAEALASEPPSGRRAPTSALKLYAGIFSAGLAIIAIGMAWQPSRSLTTTASTSSVEAEGDAAAKELDAQAQELSSATRVSSGRPDAISTMVEGKANLRANLKDPDSAQFRNLFVSKLDNGALALCGEVNSKNGYGGYTGSSRFIASANASAPTLVEGDAAGLGEQIDSRLFPQAYTKFCGNVVERF